MADQESPKISPRVNSRGEIIGLYQGFESLIEDNTATAEIIALEIGIPPDKVTLAHYQQWLQKQSSKSD